MTEMSQSEMTLTNSLTPRSRAFFRN